MVEAIRISSTDDVELEAHLALPSGASRAPGVLLLHGFPSGAVPASHVGADLSELCERVALEMGWVALAVRFRGCGSSTGSFSIRGWAEDAAAGLARLREARGVAGEYLVGFGTGGALALSVAAADDGVAGVAVAGTPADFLDWIRRPEELVARCRYAGAIPDIDDADIDLEAWKEDVRSVRPSAAAEALADRPLLVLHGTEDEAVPQFDGRSIADAHGNADLRIIPGAGHQLRHDPRALAVLLGWLERRRNS
ncbi:MAG: alpha/beta hydrolase family protein [Acidimicrobiales bacterium]